MLFRKGVLCVCEEVRRSAQDCARQGSCSSVPPPSPHLFHPPITSHSLLMAIASGFTGPAKPLAKVFAAVLILFVTTHCAILP